MDRVYQILEQGPREFDYMMRREPNFEQNVWGMELVSTDQFEGAEHILIAQGTDYKGGGTSDKCPDMCEVDRGIWTIPEKAWGWIPELQAAGCRRAENVKVKKGKKQYRLIYPAPVLDLLDHTATTLTWNSGTVSAAHDWHLYDWDGAVPMMFQVIYHNKIEYKGSMFRLSGRCAVSKAFVDEYTRRGLTGVEFKEIPRTKRPESASDSPDVHLNRR